MKLFEHSNTLQTNVQGETQSFGIQDCSVIIEILRNKIYSHKIRTLTQEYISNAFDSHRELGKKDNKFDITVPTALNPVLKIRDYGPGVNPQRMSQVFIMYGSSTKRENNNEIGGLGLGAKSAFSYSDSFSIVTFVDGTKRSYVAHIGANNQGRLDLVAVEETKEENGTEIQIAVKPYDVNKFRDAVM